METFTGIKKATAKAHKFWREVSKATAVEDNRGVVTDE